MAPTRRRRAAGRHSRPLAGLGAGVGTRGRPSAGPGDPRGTGCPGGKRAEDPEDRAAPGGEKNWAAWLAVPDPGRTGTPRASDGPGRRGRSRIGRRPPEPGRYREGYGSGGRPKGTRNVRAEACEARSLAEQPACGSGTGTPDVGRSPRSGGYGSSADARTVPERVRKVWNYSTFCGEGTFRGSRSVQDSPGTRKSPGYAGICRFPDISDILEILDVLSVTTSRSSRTSVVSSREIPAVVSGNCRQFLKDYLQNLIRVALPLYAEATAQAFCHDVSVFLTLRLFELQTFKLLTFRLLTFICPVNFLPPGQQSAV
jgi:hypothetical protein